MDMMLTSLHSYIWQHLEIGYVQGMCDLLAPLLVILDDGELTLLSQGCDCVFLPHSPPWYLRILRWKKNVSTFKIILPSEI